MSASQSNAVFILGMERSGTSLVRAILSQHREIAISARGELSFYGKWDQKYGPDPTEEQRERFVRELLAEPSLEHWEADWSGFRHEPAGGDFYQEVLGQLGEFYRQQKGKPLWGEKSTESIEKLPQVTAAFPGAAYLLVVRDPRDSYLSVKNVKWHENHEITPASYGAHWASVYCRALGQLQTRTDRFAVTRHEDMTLHSKPTLKRALESLGLAYYPELLRPKDLNWEMNSSFGDQKWTSTEHRQHTRELKIDPSSVGRWKEHLSEKEVAELEEAAKFGMLAFGYEMQSEAGESSWQGRPNLLRRVKRKLKRLIP